MVRPLERPETYGQHVFSHEEDTEEERLVALATTFDPASRAAVDSAGFRSDWHCLDVGSGSGTMARWMADRIGPEGSVTAIDRDTRYLRARPHPRLDVRQVDVTAFEPPEGRFDLVHSRMMVMHVRERDALVRRMATWLKPGGVLVLGDTAELGGRTSANPAYRAAIVALSRLLEETVGSDVLQGRRYPGLLTACGLEDVTLSVDLPVVTAGSAIARFWELSIGQTGPRMVADGLIEPSDVAAALEYLRDPATRELSFVLCTAVGRRPR